MPTTVIQVLGSLAFKTIDSVLKVDHVDHGKVAMFRRISTMVIKQSLN